MAADIFVHPTFYDPCSLVLLEALACGLPAITTRFSGAAELMQSGVHGFVLPDPADSRMLAKTMGRLLDPGLRTRMGNAARQLALKCTAQNSFEQILATYHAVIANGRGRNSRAWNAKS
jgi:UDP-glucose:(heptosyl)LPS alpha-1,3-glucosyltransferase